MSESPAQRAAREANLRKGNPAAYGGSARGVPRERDEQPAQGAPRTIRARAPGAPQGAPRAKRAARAPKTPSAAQGRPRAREDERRPSSGGFLGGLLEGLGG